MLEQDYMDLMTRHRPKGISSVDYTMSSKLPNAMSTKFFAQHVLIIAHVGVSMNLIRRQQMSNNLKKYKSLKHWP